MCTTVISGLQMRKQALRGKESFPKVPEVGSQSQTLNTGLTPEPTLLTVLSYNPTYVHVLFTLIDHQLCSPPSLPPATGSTEHSGETRKAVLDDRRRGWIEVRAPRLVQALASYCKG